MAILIPPAATITVTPATVPLETTLEVVADPDLTAVDVAARRIPARRLAVTLDRQVREPVTGRIDVPGEPAHGTIVFINQGESQVTIPAGSVVSASSEVAVRFRTRRAVTLPGPAGTTARVEIKAVEPGPRGNVPVYAVDVLDPSLGLPVAVVNERALEGGTSRRVSIVTQEEISRVRGALLDRMRREAAQMLEAQVRESERLIDDSLAIQVTDESFSEEVGAIAEAVSIKLTVQAVGLAIDEEQVRQLAAAGLGRQVPAEQVLVDGSFEFDIRSMAADEGGAARVRVEAVAMAQARVGKSDVKDVVRGRPVGEVPALLRERLPIEGAPVVNVSRAWLGRMPWLPVRIDVVISEP
ncbi:MAG: hypothetical protein MAG451_01747 [Anaerolineales bacterium]|nr:hypothetical protein [Anaerolineales bacterium]